MKKTIWKFELETTDYQTLEIPEDFEILTVQTQNEKPNIWALVNPDSGNKKVRFEIFGTGHAINNIYERKYVGTYQLHSGSLVFHVFQIINPL